MTGIDSPSAAEGGDLTYTVTLSGPSDEPVVLDLGLGGTATSDDYMPDFVLGEGATYDPTTGQVTVDPGTTSFTVTLRTRQDDEPEPDETLALTIGGVTGVGTIRGTPASGIGPTATLTGQVVGVFVRTPPDNPRYITNTTAGALADSGKVVTIGGVMRFRFVEDPVTREIRVQQLVGPGQWVTVSTVERNASVKYGWTYEWEVGVTASAAGTFERSGPSGGSADAALYTKFKPFYTLQVQDVNNPRNSGDQFRFRVYPATGTLTAGGTVPFDPALGFKQASNVTPLQFEWRWGTVTKEPPDREGGTTTFRMYEAGFSATFSTWNEAATYLKAGASGEEDLRLLFDKTPSFQAIFQVWGLGINEVKKWTENYEGSPRLEKFLKMFGQTFQHLVVTALLAVRTTYGRQQFDDGSIPAPDLEVPTGDGSVARRMLAPVEGRLLSDSSAEGDVEGADPSLEQGDALVAELFGAFQAFMEFLDESGLQEIFEQAGPLIDLASAAIAARSGPSMARYFLDQLSPDQKGAVYQAIAEEAFRLVLEAGLPDSEGNVDLRWNVIKRPDESVEQYTQRLMGLIMDKLPEAVLNVLTDLSNFDGITPPAWWPPGSPPPPPPPPPPGGPPPPFVPPPFLPHGGGWGDPADRPSDPSGTGDIAPVSDPASTDPRDVYAAAYFSRLAAGYSEEDADAYADACVAEGFDVAMGTAFAQLSSTPGGYSLTSGDVQHPGFMAMLKEKWLEYKASGLSDPQARDRALIDTALFMYGGATDAAQLTLTGDANGSLANWELAEAVGCDIPTADRLMALYDGNADGVVDRDEVQAMMSEGVLELAPGAPARLHFDAVPAQRYAAALVRLGSSDADPMLNNAELVDALRFFGLDISLEQADTMIDMFGNGDVVDEASITAMLEQGVLWVLGDGQLDSLLPEEVEVTGDPPTNSPADLMARSGSTDDQLSADELATALNASGSQYSPEDLALFIRYYRSNDNADVVTEASLQAAIDDGVLVQGPDGRISMDLSRVPPLRVAEWLMRSGSPDDALLNWSQLQDAVNANNGDNPDITEEEARLLISTYGANDVIDMSQLTWMVENRVLHNDNGALFVDWSQLPEGVERPGGGKPPGWDSPLNPFNPDNWTL